MLPPLLPEKSTIRPQVSFSNDWFSACRKAAAADRTSFGCEPQRDWTYFGDAYFNRALRGGASMLEGFERAKVQISTWETEQRLTPSNPQSAIGANAVAMLQRAEREAH